MAHATKLWRSEIKWHKWLELCSFFLFGHIRVFNCMFNAFAKMNLSSCLAFSHLGHMCVQEKGATYVNTQRLACMSVAPWARHLFFRIHCRACCFLGEPALFLHHHRLLFSFSSPRIALVVFFASAGWNTFTFCSSACCV